MLRLVRLQNLYRIQSRGIYQRTDIDEEGKPLKTKLEHEMDFYKILEVPKYASQEEIKRKYHHLAKVHHPDAGGDADQFVLVQTAFATLGDLEKRKAYNDEKREKETTRIRIDTQTDEDKKYSKLSTIMENVTVSSTRPDYTGAQLLMGMVNPKPNMPLFAVAVPTIILGNLAMLYLALKHGLFSEFYNSMLEYKYTYKAGVSEIKAAKLQMLTGGFLATFVGLALWAEFHHYMLPMYHHLNYPGFLVYSVSYRKSTDQLFLICGNTDKSKMFRPQQMFITIDNISKMDLEPALDKVSYGFGANSKTISFDLPYEHSFGIQKYRRKFYETIWPGDEQLQSRQLERTIEQLKATHIVAHIPHFLKFNQTLLEDLPMDVPLVNYIAKNDYMRTHTSYNQKFGREMYEHTKNNPLTFEN